MVSIPTMHCSQHEEHVTSLRTSSSLCNCAQKEDVTVNLIGQWRRDVFQRRLRPQVSEERRATFLELEKLFVFFTL